MAMAPNYDSESESDGESFTTTNVLLGYASKEPTDDSVSQLGGFPVWLGSEAPSASYAQCSNCQRVMALLLQLNADLPEHFPGHERRLYIFGCKNKACRRTPGYVKALRSIKMSPTAVVAKDEPAKKEPDPPRNLGNDIFGGSKPSVTSKNPFSMNSDSAWVKGNPFAASSSTSNPFSAKLSDAPDGASVPGQATSRIADQGLHFKRAEAKPWPSQDDKQSSSYPSFYLDADYESLDKPKPELSPSHLASRLEDVDMNDDSQSGSVSAKEDKEAFESRHDKSFQKFADRVAQNPEQVLRYEFRGAPLLYSDGNVIGCSLLYPHAGFGVVRRREEGKVVTAVLKKGETSLPPCQNCGAKRVFECQLMPHAIVELESEEEGLDGMEWGTIIVGVCEKDCEEAGWKSGEVGFVEEWAGVQWEELRQSGGKGK